MKKEKKSAQLIVKLTEREKAFLVEKAEEEGSNISDIVNAALEEKYKEYKEMRRKNNNEN